ncbi:MAG: hypothetical protein NTV15_04820 [Candidatus Bathyarchaeota archaeon]|nr:hypothetical protein [Candidatus Bathyarchaeota archaeon]
MIIERSVTGVQPRTQELIAKTRSYDRGKLTEQELETAYTEATKIVIKGQIDAELTQINSGMLKRQDLLRPFSAGLGGCAVGPMIRWFNNNTFYKTPLIKGELQWKESVTLKEAYVDELPKLAWKAVLPAPYTFMALSHDSHYNNAEKLMFAFAEVLNQEAKELEKKGFTYIQFSDPALVYVVTKPRNMEAAAKALEIATKGLKATTCLQTYFGDAAPVLKTAENWAVTDIGIDLYETDLRSVKKDHNKGLILGIVDARNSVIEDAVYLSTIVKQIQETYKPKRLAVSTNCDMDFLTWDKAEAKMRILTLIAENLGGK